MRNEKLGIIEKIRIYPTKGEAGTELSEGRLIENLGLEGDFYAKGVCTHKPGNRQVSFRLIGSAESVNAESEIGLCTGRFKENLTIRCQTPFFAKGGMQLSIGEAILEISDETKQCHEECQLFLAGKRCSLAGMNLFAKVIKGGGIRVGDEIN